MISPPLSRPGEVLPQLPRSDLLVIAAPLVALDADEVVDVVLVAGAPERAPKDVVALELVDGLEQVRRQRAKTAGGELLEWNRIEVFRVRLARVERVLDPVESGGEDRGGGQVRIARSVHRAVFDPARPRDAEHLRPVVVAVADPDG